MGLVWNLMERFWIQSNEVIDMSSVWVWLEMFTTRLLDDAFQPKPFQSRVEPRTFHYIPSRPSSSEVFIISVFPGSCFLLTTNTVLIFYSTASTLGISPYYRVEKINSETRAQYMLELARSGY